MSPNPREDKRLPRRARVVVPGAAHHVTQRGNRRGPIFFEDGDQALYCDLLAEQTSKHGVEVWAWCLMPNHVHLIMTPIDDVGLVRAVGETHRRYTRAINTRHGWTGHLFQSRFSSVAMDETHLVSAVRYVSLNPVRARLVKRAEDWPWSSVRAHLAGKDGRLTKVLPVLDRVERFADLLLTDANDPAFQALRAREKSGRPWGKGT